MKWQSLFFSFFWVHMACNSHTGPFLFFQASDNVDTHFICYACVDGTLTFLSPSLSLLPLCSEMKGKLFFLKLWVKQKKGISLNCPGITVNCMVFSFFSFFWKRNIFTCRGTIWAWWEEVRSNLSWTIFTSHSIKGIFIWKVILHSDLKIREQNVRDARMEKPIQELKVHLNFLILVFYFK